MLGEHEGSVEELGDAEDLLLQLESIPMFQSKLRFMYNMSKFDAAVLKSAAESYNNACIELCESPVLLKLLSSLLCHANFMNSGRGESMQVSFTPADDKHHFFVSVCF